MGGEDYIMVLECAKDSVVNPTHIGDPDHKITQGVAELYDLYDDGAPPTNTGALRHG